MLPLANEADDTMTMSSVTWVVHFIVSAPARSIPAVLPAMAQCLSHPLIK